MFGFVRPLKAELKIKDYELFKAAYCGVCHQLKRRCGPLGRYIINYDFTFLAMLFAHGCEICMRRCPASPLRRKKHCVSDDGTFARAADMSVILAYLKTEDAVRDKEGFKYRLFRMALRRGYRSAAQAESGFDSACREQLRQLALLEGGNNPVLDENADKFARILAGAAAGEQGGRQRVLTQLLYQLGRYVYIADAVCDLDEDKRAGRFNAVAARWPEGVDTDGVRRILTHTHGLICTAFELLEHNEFTPVLENIIYMGIPEVTEAVLDGSYRSLVRKERIKPVRRTQ